jgi:hypothetical protein
MNILEHTFRDQNLTISVRDNPGYQEGAMAALSDATQRDGFQILPKLGRIRILLCRL